MLKVQIKSKETIKPSSPTSPNHPPIQLSSLDHISPPIYTHILLFYSTTTTINPNHLKTSLSTTLLHFSPLAGRIHRSSSNGTLYAHCTNEGAIFVEAEVHQACNIQSFLTADHHASSSSPIDEFPELLPIKKDNFNLLSEDPLLAVQLTVFDSGGFVLGLSMCHLIADGASMAFFLKQWSSISRSGAIIGSLPNFDSASLFSPQPWSASTVEKTQDDEHDEKNTITKVSIKRFVIDKEGIERLRVSKQGWRPTRVQAVLGLVWRCLRRAKLAGNHASQVVNIRKKMMNMVPMLSEKDFGNLWVSVIVSTSDHQCGRIEEEEEALREAVTCVNEEYVRNFIEGKVKKNDACWIFTSWCRMGFYESSDFGWGEPDWVGCGLREMKDVCMLIDAKDGVGVEVWVWLDEDGMMKLENDPEFLTFVSF
ncbi:Transferase protein [Dioscorea alata]|uniref:Transferase protein n=1 Tax=Dioscorea alata TaxID=55571 RepID=A0ACB7WAA3_DIOAL|nr:Transferase protein [Dioscorea alata]